MPEFIDRVRLARGRAYVMRKLDEAAMIGVLNLGVDTVLRARENFAPVKTGRLARSLTHGAPYRIRPYVWGIDVGSNVEYAMAQEYGSGLFSEDETKRRKYQIIAGAFNPDTKSLSPKKALKFKWNDAPTALAKANPKHPIYFFKSVMHPGVKPKRYLRNAADAARAPDNYRKIMFKSLNAAFRVATG